MNQEETTTENTQAGEQLSFLKEDKFVIDCTKKLPSLREVAYKYIMFAVKYHGGAKDRTAKEIRIDRKTLYRRVLEGPSQELSLKKVGA